MSEVLLSILVSPPTKYKKRTWVSVDAVLCLQVVKCLFAQFFCDCADLMSQQKLSCWCCKRVIHGFYRSQPKTGEQKMCAHICVCSFKMATFQTTNYKDIELKVDAVAERRPRLMH